MKKFLTKLRGIKIEYTRTHPLTKTAIGALLVLSLAALLALAWTGGNLRAEIRDMQPICMFMAMLPSVQVRFTIMAVRSSRSRSTSFS